MRLFSLRVRGLSEDTCRCAIGREKGGERGLTYQVAWFTSFQELYGSAWIMNPKLPIIRTLDLLELSESSPLAVVYTSLIHRFGITQVSMEASSPEKCPRLDQH